VGSHGFFRVQRSIHGFVGLLALCSTAAFSLFSNGILAVPLAHYSSASAPDFHRLPLFSLLSTGHKTDMQFSGKRKSHTGRLLPVWPYVLTSCLPSPHLRDALRVLTWSVFWLCASRRRKPSSSVSSLLRFPQWPDLSKDTGICAYSYGYSPDSNRFPNLHAWAFSTDPGHGTPCSNWVVKVRSFVPYYVWRPEAWVVGDGFVKENPWRKPESPHTYPFVRGYYII